MPTFIGPIKIVYMKSVTHIAGNVITACGRIIQRCSLCGEKMCDSQNAMMPLEADGSLPVFPTWEVGRLIRVTPGQPTSWVMLEDTDKLPDDSCYDLIEN